MVWRAVVCSKMDYGAEITVPGTKNLANRLESVQQQACTAMLKLNSRTSVHAVRRAMGCPSAESRRCAKQIKFAARLENMSVERWPAHVYSLVKSEADQTPKS